jgi:hypothetical protein
MRIRFVKRYGNILSGSTPNIDDKLAKQLIDREYAVEIAESDKSIDEPPKDKMVRKTKRK